MGNGEAAESQILDDLKERTTHLIEMILEDLDSVYKAIQDSVSELMTSVQEVDTKASSWLEENFQSAPSFLMGSMATLLVATMIAVLWGKQNVEQQKKKDFDVIENEKPLTDDLMTLIKSKTVLKHLTEEIEMFQNGARDQVVKDALALAILNDRMKILNEIMTQVSRKDVKFRVNKGESSPRSREVID